MIDFHDMNWHLLDYKTPIQLLIAVMLSAQTTDRQVNIVTPLLFSRYPDARSLAAADKPDVEKIIHSLGFYRTKAANIIMTARIIQKIHGGNVPGSMEELTALPGVGRKTAGVILAVLFSKPALIVDTHFIRLVNRLGLCSGKDPLLIERCAAVLIDKSVWSDFSLAATLHGRTVCKSRSPECSRCVVAMDCPFAYSLK